ncbi:MAG TPA: hypothetical protein VIO11_01675 [Candidatus Methanoperedens sp.]
MISIQAPEKIKRGVVLRGKVIIEPDKEVNARSVSVSFDNELSYSNPCTKNFSSWNFSNPGQLFGEGPGLRNAMIPFEFNIPKEAPPTYGGKSLKSSWKINVKIDIPLSRDIHAAKNVEVER